MTAALNVSTEKSIAIKPTKTKRVSFLSGANSLSGRDLLNVIDAASLHIKLKNRKEHPAGTFDNGKRFYLSKKFDCCQGIYPPSRSYPLSHNTHARSVVHVAHEAGLKDHISLIRKISKFIEKNSLEDVYKLFKDSQTFQGAILERELGV